MDNPSPASGQKHRPLHLFLLALVCLAAFWLRTEGINWPKLNSDEYPIAIWIEHTIEHGYFTDKVYAGGFFTLALPVQAIVRTIQRHVNAFAFHKNATNRLEDKTFDAIMFARWLNVWLGTLTCLLLYGLGRRVTESGGAGVVAAALFAFAQYPVEHSHYGETDMAMLFMLTLAFWIWAGVISNRRLPVFGAAALVSGFAAGTKFPLVLLAAVVLVMGLIGTGRPIAWRGVPRRNAGLAKALGYAGLGLGLFILGLLLANPRIVMDLSGFLSGLAWESRRLQSETALNMGLMSHNLYTRYCLHLLELARCCMTLGWGWIGLVLLGLPCACLKEYRRYWPILLLFPALYTLYWIFAAPWVRSQEFLSYLPALTVLATLPLVVLWRTRRPLFRATAVLMACAALLCNAGNGLRPAALFGWTDTRLLARQWLEQRLPDSAQLSAEPYTARACPETRNPPLAMGGKIERKGISSLKEQGVDFVLRSPSHVGRGLIHPLTGERYPDNERLFDEFRDHSERLAAWAPLTRGNLATFISPAIELWGFAHFIPSHKLAVELSQPLLINDAYMNERLRPTFFPIGRKLGSTTGLLIDKRPRMLAIGGPEGRTNPVYLMLNTEERGTTVQVQGFGRRQIVTLAPYSVAILPLNRFYWPGKGMPFERITLAATPQKDITYIPCYARVVYSPDEAARICADLGQPDVFWQFFTAADLARMKDPIRRYLLAVRSAHWDEANRWEQAAIQAATELTASIKADPTEVEINGTSGYYYEALARTRLQERDLFLIYQDTLAWPSRRNITDTILMCLDLSLHNQPAGKFIENSMNLPIRLAHGTYELSGELFVKPAPAPKNIPPDIEYTVNRRQSWLELRSADSPAGWTPFTTRFSVDREIQPTITARSKTPAKLYFQNLTIRWSLSSTLAVLDRSLNIARAVHALHRNRPAAALALLDNMDESLDLPDALEIRQLKFQALLDIEDSGFARLADAAKDVLALAPATYACLVALTAGDPAAGTRAKDLTANLKQPLACGQFLALLGCAFDPARKELACIFEVLKNETPPLAVSLNIRQHGKWRKRQVEALSARPRLYRGERVPLRIKLDESFGAVPAAENIALGIESAVQWHPSAIPIAEQPAGLIPLAEIVP